MKSFCTLLTLLCLSLGSFAQDTLSVAYKEPIEVRCGNAYPPFEFINANGEPDGFNVDLIRAVMDQAGLKYNLCLGRWKNVVDSLKSSQIDMVVGVTYSIDRAEKMNFGMSHTFIKQIFAVMNDSHFMAEKDLSGKRVAVHNGGYAQGILGQILPDVQVIPCFSTEDALRQLVNGKCDAVLLNEGTLDYFQNHGTGFEDIRKIESSAMPSEYRMATNVKIGKSLLPVLNTAMFRICADGTYDKIANKWFGESQDHKNLRVSLWGLGILGALFFFCLGVIFYSKFRINKAKRKLDEQHKKIVRQMEVIKGSEGTLKTILDLIDVPIFIVDVDNNFKIVYSNRYAHDQFDVVEGISVTDLLLDGTAQPIKNDYLKTFASNRKGNWSRELSLARYGRLKVNCFYEPIILDEKAYVLTLCLLCK